MLDMHSIVRWVLLILIPVSSCHCNAHNYQASWESLSTRSSPQWYEEAKVGIWIHWGVYSVPGFGSEWFIKNWRDGNQDYVKFMKDNYAPGFTYFEFARDFRAQFFDPNAWADLFKKSGAKYVILTAKHRSDGYTLWPTKYSYGWNSQDVGPHRDLVGDVASALRNNTDLKFGVYYSLSEEYHPFYLDDKKSNFQNNTYVTQKVYPELVELVTKYHPDIVWAKETHEAPDTYWKSKEFLTWLYNDSPVRDTVLANDLWGSNGVTCNSGDIYSCSGKRNSKGVLHLWASERRLDKYSWGHRRNTRFYDYLTIEEMILQMVEVVSTGGNIMFNVGATAEGTITPIEQELLLNLGSWLAINGEAIYKSKPWKISKEGNIWFTSKEPIVYVFVLQWPLDSTITLTQISEQFLHTNTVVKLLGNSEILQWINVEKGINITLPDKAVVKSQWSWVLKIEPGNLPKTY